MYMPLQNTCMTARSIAEEPSMDDLYALDSASEITPGAEDLGTVHAISAASGETIWNYGQPAAVMSLIATGGGLIFGGDVAGRFWALDQMTGEVLWEVDLGSQVTGYPVTYAVTPSSTLPSAPAVPFPRCRSTAWRPTTGRLARIQTCSYSRCRTELRFVPIAGAWQTLAGTVRSPSGPPAVG